jgi:hypothetical protein
MSSSLNYFIFILYFFPSHSPVLQFKISLITSLSLHSLFLFSWSVFFLSYNLAIELTIMAL